MEERVKAVVAKELLCDLDQITHETNLRTDLNMDSLDEVSVIIELENEFEIEIHEDLYGGITTLQEFIDLVKSKVN